MRCSYNHYYWHYYYDEYYESDPMYGIIVEVDYAQYESLAEVDIIYVVFCTDGVYRFFIEEEMYRLS